MHLIHFLQILLNLSIYYREEEINFSITPTNNLSPTCPLLWRQVLKPIFSVTLWYILFSIISESSRASWSWRWRVCANLLLSFVLDVIFLHVCCHFFENKPKGNRMKTCQFQKVQRVIKHKDGWLRSLVSRLSNNHLKNCALDGAKVWITGHKGIRGAPVWAPLLAVFTPS